VTPAGIALVVGEALVDVVETDGAAIATPGGSPANVALGLGRLGVDVTLHTALGDDRHGHLVADRMRASGVEVTPTSWTTHRTSSASVSLGVDGAPTYAFDVGWDPAPVPPVAADVALVHTGSIAAALEPGAARVRAGAAAAKAAGALVTFDPNVRPGLLADPAAARERILDLLTLSDAVKLSDEDAAWLFPGRSVDEVLDTVLDRGATLAAVTTGVAGSTLATAAHRVRCRPATVVAVDTIGAGDTYMAALIACLLREPQALRSFGGPTRAWIEAAGQLASAASAVTVGRAGADLPWLDELAGY
jgi:fructokinase